MQETGHFVPTQEYKEPPTLYYLSYAILFVNLTYLLCRRFMRGRNEVIEWISANSLWIYLWHIFALYLLKFTFGFLEHILLPESHLAICLAVTLYLILFGMLLCHVQRRVVGKYLKESRHRFIRRIAAFLV